MPTIPSGDKIVFTSADVELKERKSARINAQSQAYTMQDIADTVNAGPISSFKLNYPESFTTLPSLPSNNLDNNKITILEEFDTDAGATGGMFNGIWSLNVKGSTPINGYLQQMYNIFEISTPETESASRIQTQKNIMSYKGEENAFFVQGDSCFMQINEAADGNVYPPKYFYALTNDMICSAGTGILPDSGSSPFWLGQRTKITLDTDNLGIDYLYGIYLEWDINNNVNVNTSMRQLYLNADLEGQYSGNINQYVGIYHDADGFTVGGNTAEGHFIFNSANMPITTAGGMTFSGGLPAHADDAAAGASGLTAGQVYQTDGTGSAPLNVAGILMIKQ